MVRAKALAVPVLLISRDDAGKGAFPVLLLSSLYGVCLLLSADSFLHHMVRILVGTIVGWMSWNSDRFGMFTCGPSPCAIAPGRSAGDERSRREL